ncbi:hypothetical protein [Actinomycetospora chiangmaiensis]|uniref:hypothetical protein n=1 Tax=Actinomycetospora chiangmaiensis TaxID=402650 RepID=UPI00146EBCA0|nr:hypothetical protein [Actinomycetospora chiangmaiensis]
MKRVPATPSSRDRRAEENAISTFAAATAWAIVGGTRAGRSGMRASRWWPRASRRSTWSSSVHSAR